MPRFRPLPAERCCPRTLRSNLVHSGFHNLRSSLVPTTLVVWKTSYRVAACIWDTTGIPAAQQSVFGSFLLTGDAEIFLASKLNDLKARTGATLPSMTWDEFQIMLIEGYCKPELNISARTALNSLRQNRLTVPDLARELRRLSSRISPAVTVAEQVYVFLMALKPELRLACGAHPSGREWTNLHDLVQLATLTEANLGALPASAGRAQDLKSTATASASASAGKGNPQWTKKRAAGFKSTSASAEKRPRNVGATASAGTSVFGITDAEYQRRRANNHCLYCDKHGHRFGRSCPFVKDGAAGHVSPAGNKPTGPLKVN